jgi:hypothetical protein
MNTKSWARIGGVAVIGAVVVAALNGCAAPVTLTPPPLVDGVLAQGQFQREAREGGFVTVDAGVVPGALPETNMSGPPFTVAWFSNEGEGGKHEKLYGWKPNTQAEYDLVLSDDGSGRTKWTMNEINRITKGRTAVRSGHLWTCEPDWHPIAGKREVGFKDCPQRIQYDSSDLSLNSDPKKVAAFASYIPPRESGSEEALAVSPPVWISCTSGCCTLGR